MRVSVVIHGPEAVDSRLAFRVIELLGGYSEVRAKMSGYTGVAAVVDAGLEGLIDISRHYVPSATLIDESTSADLLVFVNKGKNRRSAIRLGEMVYSRVKEHTSKPLLQVDDGFIIKWQGDTNLYEIIAERLGLDRVAPSKEEVEGNGDWRKLIGILPGENVWVNGIVVGRATSEQVQIACDEDGRIIAEGLELKETGVARLGRFSPKAAKVRSGLTRRTTNHPRIKPNDGSEGIFLVDHAAERAIYQCRRARFVVTVGDDTSRATGSVLSRFGVPILALTDGDEDGIVQDRTLAPGSIIFRLKPGNDDIIGARVRAAVFDGGDRVEDLSLEEVASKIRRLAGDALEEEISVIIDMAKK